MNRLLQCLFLGVMFFLHGMVPESSGAQELTLDQIFPTDRVLKINLTVAEEDWDKIRNQSLDFQTALAPNRKFAPIDSPYTYVVAKCEIDGKVFPKVGIRKKGFIGSQSTSRPSLKVKLNFSDKDAEIDGLSSLTLNNNHQDKTLLSQFMGYQIFNAAGSPAPRCAFAEVLVNGKSLGVYSHVESAKKPFVARAFGNTKGTLYEGTVVDFHKDWEGSFDRKFGSKKSGLKKIKAVIKMVQEFEEKRSSEGFDVEAAVAKHFDLDSFYQFWAVEGLLGFWDGYSGNRNNYFVYLNPETDKFHFMPWGGDCMFQKMSLIDRDPRLPVSVKTTGKISHLLYQTERGKERYKQTLLKLMNEHWDEDALLKEADRIDEMLEPHLAKIQNFRGRSESVRKFIRNRRGDIMKEIANGMPVWEKPSGPPVIIPAGRRGFDPDTNNIFDAARKGDLDRLKKMVGRPNIDINQKDPNGTAPLTLAAIAGRVKAAKFLLENGAKINTANNHDSTPLHVAALFGQVEIVKLLIEEKADLNLKDKDGSTALDTANAKWENIKGIVEMFDKMMQLELDMEQVRKNREEIAELLKKSGGKGR